MKISLVLLAALAANALLRKRSAAVRHGILAAAIACAAAMPLLERWLPSWQLPVPITSAAQVRDAATVSGGNRTAPADVPRFPVVTATDSAQRPAAFPFRAGTGTVLGGIWLAGVGLSLFVIVAGFGRLAWLASRAQHVSDERWADLAGEIAAQYGLKRRIILLQTDHPSLLVTWGIAPPKVILPVKAREWPDEIVRAVLAHELAHIQRGDWIAHMLGALLRAVYWFNPIVWLACHRLRLESEHACDDAVISGGMAAPDYAARLFEVARALNRPRTWVPAAAMARTSTLERRISAMLNDRVNRSSMSRSARTTATLAVLALTIAVASAQTFGAVSGTAVDPQGALLPEVRLILSNAGRAAKYEVRSDRTGQFEFIGLPPGDYLLEAQLAGFATLRQTVTVAGQRVPLTLALAIGSLTESITVVDPSGDSRPPAAAAVQTVPARVNPPCTASAGDPRIGGNIRAPRKIRDVRPEYPARLRGSGTDGDVLMDGRIGLDGFIHDLRVLNDAHSEFASAALAAVGGWQFDSTLLNCAPVEVAVTVTIRFRHAR